MFKLTQKTKLKMKSAYLTHSSQLLRAVISAVCWTVVGVIKAGNNPPLWLGAARLPCCRPDAVSSALLGSVRTASDQISCCWEETDHQLLNTHRKRFFLSSLSFVWTFVLYKDEFKGSEKEKSPNSL